MKLPNDINFKVAPVIKEPKYLIFSDFDETYLAHYPTKEHKDQLRKLEEFIVEECPKRNILFGWVTGSTEASLLSKMVRHELTVLPHFIAHSMGTELFYFNSDVPHGKCDINWQEKLSRGNYNPEKIEAIVKQLHVNSNISLVPQQLINSSSFKISHYYYQVDKETDQQALERINEIAKRNNLSVNFSKCNPKAGDPADCYDVDWMPEMAGKVQIVKFLAAKYSVPYKNMLAFGDSQNDIEMLQAVKYGCLVENALDIAKADFSNVINKPYAEGILSVMREICL